MTESAAQSAGGPGDWQKVCRDAELAEGASLLVKLGDADVHLSRLDGKVYAVGNKCTHYECPLNEGARLGRVVVCRCHDARFDITTGKVLSAPALNDLPVYPVRIEAGDVLLGPVEKAKFPKPEGTDARTFLIVGGGAAGNAAAETLRREGFAGRILMITAESDPPYDRPNLSKEFISGEAKPEWMPLRGAKFYANQKIELLTDTRVTALDPRAKNVTLHDGRRLAFDKALLATGGAPRLSTVPGSQGEGCFTLRSFADARAIAAAAEGARSAVLVGAGFIGLELASSLRARGIAVDVVTPEPLPLARIVGERIALWLKDRHEQKMVAFHLGTTVKEIAGPRGGKTVALSDGGTLEADFVVFGLGVQPVVDYLAGTDLARDGAVPVNGRLETSYPDILAAGDIALVPDHGSGEARRIEHWVVAERQGQHAARSMLGAAAPFDEVPFFWTRQTGISLKYVGLARAWDDIAWRGDLDAGKFLAGFYREGRLLAAASVGMPTELTAVELMLRRGAPLPAGTLSDAKVDLLALARG
jgi:apoptosis-inducing factor 3